MKRSIAEKILASTGWLSHQPVAFQRTLLSAGKIEIVEVEQYVFHFDDEPGGIFGIIDGGIGVLIPTMGSNFRLATILRSGVWFGYGPLVRRPRRSLSFRATEPSALMRVELGAVNQLRAAHPDAMSCFATLSE